jgi:RNA polymerase-binding transcription factor DksA
MGEMEAHEVRVTLERARADHQRRIAALTSEVDEIVSAAADANGDDEHDPEGSTVAFERARVTALVASARGAVVELDRALVRLDAGTYGQCARCGDDIGTGRLDALPAAETCIGCASRSRSGVP